MSTENIGWDACAGRTNILAQQLSETGNVQESLKPATEWDLWMAGYVRRERIEEFLDEKESNTGKVRADDLRDLLIDGEPGAPTDQPS